MILTGANNFSENDNYTIYTVNSNQNGQYSVVIPKNNIDQISMFVDMNMKSDFDSLISNNITKESLIEKINKEYNNIKEKYKEGILVIPMTDITNLTNAVNSNDKQKIFDETKKIGGTTSELYKNLIESGIDKSKINQKITIIEKTETDTKFVDWLKTQMPNFIDGIKLVEESQNIENTNPFANVNPFNIEQEPKQDNDIFAKEEINIQEENKESQPEEIKEPVAPTETIQEEIKEQPEKNIFPNNNPEENKESQPEENKEPVTPTETMQEEIKEPQPVNSVSLENTTVIPTESVEQKIDDQPKDVNQNQNNNNELVENEIDKKSGGFANILILLVILAVVTIGSIELGKFLFNTFGA